MSFWRGRGSVNPDEPVIKHRRREPGHGAGADTIYEVWSDLIDLRNYNPAEIAELGRRAVQHMRDQLGLLVTDIQDFNIELCSDLEDQHYLLVKWGSSMSGEIGVRAFGRCLNLFGVLLVARGMLNVDPNPQVRLSKLSATQRRDMTIFQSLLKYVLDQTGEAIDEQRVV